MTYTPTPKPPRINNAQLLADSGLSIVHVRPFLSTDQSFTIAFRSSKTLIEVATAVCHKGDTFTRKVGTQKAIQAFQAKDTILIPLPRLWRDNPANYLKTIFAL